MNEIFFTADNHFFHKNMMKYCPNSRPFTSVEEMNEVMIKAWNDKVSRSDIVYCLGDFSFAKAYKTQKILDRLNGKIFLIKGNHDHLWLNVDTAKRFEDIWIYKKIHIGNQRVVLFHFPIAEWDQMHFGSYHLYGHTHNNLHIPGRAMDVGVDTRYDHSVWSYEEINSYLSQRDTLPHH